MCACTKIRKVFLTFSTLVELYIGLGLRRSPFKCDFDFFNSDSVYSGVKRIIRTCSTSSYFILYLINGFWNEQTILFCINFCVFVQKPSLIREMWHRNYAQNLLRAKIVRIGYFLIQISRRVFVHSFKFACYPSQLIKIKGLVKLKRCIRLFDTFISLQYMTYRKITFQSIEGVSFNYATWSIGTYSTVH